MYSPWDSLHLPVQDSALPLANYPQKNGQELNLVDPRREGKMVSIHPQRLPQPWLTMTMTLEVRFYRNLDYSNKRAPTNKLEWAPPTILYPGNIISGCEILLQKLSAQLWLSIGYGGWRERRLRRPSHPGNATSTVCTMAQGTLLVRRCY
jgi:hypothetical protein